MRNFSYLSNDKMKFTTINLYNGLARKNDLYDKSFNQLIEELRKIDVGPFKGGWNVHWSRRWEYPFIFSCIINVLQEKINGAEIMESGSGVNAFAFWLASLSCHVTGVDIEESLTDQWNRLDIPCRSDVNSTKFVYGDMLDLPFPDNHFDLVYSISSIEHTSDPAKAVEEMIRVTRLAGYVIFTLDLDICYSDAVKDKDFDKIQRLLPEFCTPVYPVLISSPSDILTFVNRTIDPQSKFIIGLKLFLNQVGIYNHKDYAIFAYTGQKKS